MGYSVPQAECPRGLALRSRVTVHWHCHSGMLKLFGVVLTRRALLPASSFPRGVVQAPRPSDGGASAAPRLLIAQSQTLVLCSLPGVVWVRLY